MTVERMLELVLWELIFHKGYSLDGYDLDKVKKRRLELLDDFFKDYVIDKNSKE